MIDYTSSYTGDLKTTLLLIEKRGWTVVLLEPGTKRLLAGRTWEECSTSDPRVVSKHFKKGGGIGLDVHASGLFVLDFDVSGALAAMCERLGPIPPMATSPSGGFHCYFVRFADTMPATITNNGQRVGEILRGPHQQVVMPPSPYPGNVKRGIPAGGYYSWCGDPTVGDYLLPAAWRVELNGQFRIPDFMKVGDTRGHLPKEARGDLWDGPEPEEILARASAMPRSKRRANGVKFRCPQCAAEGHDKHYDNAIVLRSGRWGCAFAPSDPKHRRAIGVALGVIVEIPEADLTKHFSAEDLNRVRSVDLSIDHTKGKI